MAKRPANVDPETWRQERSAIWKRRNRILNYLILAASAALLVRWWLSRSAG